MNTKVQNAVERLNNILPLAKRRQGQDKELADVYRKILYSNDEPVGACPFAMEPREHEVSIHQHNREISNLPDAIDVAAGFFLPLMTKQGA
jgi:hypothetical protein